MFEVLNEWDNVLGKTHSDAGNITFTLHMGSVYHLSHKVGDSSTMRGMGVSQKTNYVQNGSTKGLHCIKG